MASFEESDQMLQQAFLNLMGGQVKTEPESDAMGDGLDEFVTQEDLQGPRSIKTEQDGHETSTMAPHAPKLSKKDHETAIMAPRTPELPKKVLETATMVPRTPEEPKKEYRLKPTSKKKASSKTSSASVLPPWRQGRDNKAPGNLGRGFFIGSVYESEASDSKNTYHKRNYDQYNPGPTSIPTPLFNQRKRGASQNPAPTSKQRTLGGGRDAAQGLPVTSSNLQLEPGTFFWESVGVDNQLELVVDIDLVPCDLVRGGIKAGQVVCEAFCLKAMNEDNDRFTDMGDGRWKVTYEVPLRGSKEIIRASALGVANQKKRAQALGLTLAIAAQVQGGPQTLKNWTPREDLGHNSFQALVAHAQEMLDVYFGALKSLDAGDGSIQGCW